MNISSIHVSVEGLRINPKVSSILDKYNIVTYHDLNHQIEKRNKEVMENYFLVTANNEFKKITSSQKDSDIVYAEHQKVMKKVKALKFKSSFLDKSVKLSDLPVFKLNDHLAYNFLHGMFGKTKPKLDVSEFDNYNIEYVKDRMQEFVVKPDSVVPKVVYSKNSIGPDKYDSILESILFYDSYIEYLLKGYLSQKNPFYYKQSEKLFLVDKNKKEIFEYLNGLDEKLIIGDTKKVMKYLDLEYQNAKKIDLLFKKEQIIANYITFDEALNVTSTKVLNRFIKR